MPNIDYSRDSLLTDFAKATLKDRYMLPTEGSPQDAFARAASAFADNEEHAQRLYDYVSKLWFMFASPVLSNGGTDRGLPISCFLNYVPDSIDGIVANISENAYLSVGGGGIGSYWGDIRYKGAKVRSTGKSPGLIPFLKVVDSQMLAFNQAENRRGSCAIYLDISHPEIMEFLDMRKNTGGDIHRKCLNLHHAVNITDDFMDLVEKKYANDEFDDSFALKDPKTKKTIEHVSAKELWRKIIALRVETGEPYIHFIDTTNQAIPQCHWNKGLTIKQSNLCTEILLPTNSERTAVCCLSSVNLEKWEEWKDDALFISDLVRMLDNILESFIRHAPPAMAKAVYSASRERSLGLGAMGLHGLYQQKGIAFGSEEAATLNEYIFSCIYPKAYDASVEIGKEKGNAPDYNIESRFGSFEGENENKVYNDAKRNVYLIAIAPNASSSILAGASPGIEPVVANIYKHNTLSGTFIVKNPYLDKIIKSKVSGFAYTQVWKSITSHRGSVQQLNILSDEEKEVFKTAKEIDQVKLIEQAADRQNYIDQGQSLNLFYSTPDSAEDYKTIQRNHFLAWKLKLKTLYYLRSEELAKAEDLNKSVEREVLVPKNSDIACIGCD